MNKQYLYAYVEINIDMYTDMYINKLAKAMNEWVCVCTSQCVHIHTPIHFSIYMHKFLKPETLNPKP